jgi:hypothetical protein
MADHPRTLFEFTCEVCRDSFWRRKRPAGRNRFCSKRCVWIATKGPEFNAALARKYNPPRNRASRGTGKGKYVKRDGRHEHRIVGEQIAGRPLTFQDVVHHVDEDGHHNAPSNLEVITRPEHIRIHAPWKARWK